MDSIFEDSSEEVRHIYLEEIKMLQGEIALGVNMSSTNFMLAAAISEEDYKRSIKMDRRLIELEAEKISIQKQRYQGVDIYGHIQEGKDDNTWQAYIDNTLLMSSNEEWVKKSIAAIKKSHITEQKGPAPSISAFVNVATLIDMVIKEADASMAKAKQNNPAAQPPKPVVSPAKIFEATGLTAIKNVSVSILFYKDRIVSESNLGIKFPLKGIFNILDLTASPTSLRVPYAPDNVLAYEVSRINLLNFWQQIPKIAGEVAPPEVASQIQTGIFSISAMLGIDPGRDIFANLDTQLITVSVDSQPEPQGIYLMRLKNEIALQATLEKLFSESGLIRIKLGENFKEDTFRDAKLYQIKIPSKVPDQKSPTTIAISAAGGYLAIGPDQLVRQYLLAVDSGNPANQAFYKSRLFADLRKNTPANAVAYSAMDIGKYIKSVLGMVLDNPALKMTMANKGDDKNNPFPNFDANKLPSAEYISKFFGHTFGYVVPVANGIKSQSTTYYGKK
jgi:hypothetical protein